MTVQTMKKCALVDERKCVGCGCCSKVCKKSAITVPKGIYAVVNESKCIGCGLCEKTCPASVIFVTEMTEREGA